MNTNNSKEKKMKPTDKDIKRTSSQIMELKDLISGPLAATIDADTIAARHYLSYLMELAFESYDKETGKVGKLRMLEFNYTSQDVSGGRLQQVKIPLLTLVPLPLLQVKEADFDFDIQIVDALSADKDATLKHAADLLHVEVAAIKAVLEVETGNKGGFLAVGKPTILFEGHIFWSQLKKRGIDPAKYQKGNEDILYPSWTTKYYKGGLDEYDRLERARAIHGEAADSSASWGLAQIMGFNYAVCGSKTVAEFVEEMTKGEGNQLNLFVRFLQGNKWDVYLRNLDWKEFARHYNGSEYAKNQYDKKLEKAYQRYK